MKGMRKYCLLFLGILCAGTAMGFPSEAARASEGSSGILQYQAEEMSWDGETITLKGVFVNSSSELDITQISSATLTLKDADGKQIAETSLNTGSLEEVTLAPGESWSYRVERTVSGFNPADYNLKSGFQVSCTSDISVSSHQTKCSFCNSRGTPSFSTEDTISQEDWEALVAKLKNSLGNNTGGEIYVPNSTISGSIGGEGKKICPKCSGTGYYICESCSGMGYKERQERMFCLVAHHTDCTYDAIQHCNSCHERHDIRTVRDKCMRCGGDGKMNCSQCFGTGSCY